MGKIGSAHCNPKVKPCLNHNDRTNNRAATINKELSFKNEYSCTAKEVRGKIDKLYKKAFENFSSYCEQKNGLAKSTGKPKGLQNFTKKDRSYHEFIYEINENTTMEQVKELSQKIADLTGFTPLQTVIHRDETFTNAEGKVETHHHAHAVFFTLDKENGLQLARKEASLSEANLSKIQDLTAETLQMERGVKRFGNGVSSPKYIQDYKVYAQFKEQTKEKEKEFAEMQNRLTETAQILEKKEKEIQSSSNELKSKFDALEEREKAYNEKIRNLEEGNKKAFENLEQDFQKQKSTFKNLITFGQHNKRVMRNYERAKEALLASAKQIENDKWRMYREFKDEEEKLRQNAQWHNEQRLKLQQQYQMLEKDNKELKKLYHESYEKEQVYGNFLKENCESSALKEYFPELAEEKKQESLERFAKFSKNR